MEKYNRNENFLIRLNLFQSDGTTPLLLSACSYIQVDVMQNLDVIASYVYLTDLEITEGATTNQVKVECKTTIGFGIGVVRAKLIVRAPDGNYPVEGFQECVEYFEDLAEIVE